MTTTNTPEEKAALRKAGKVLEDALAEVHGILDTEPSADPDSRKVLDLFLRVRAFGNATAAARQAVRNMSTVDLGLDPTVAGLFEGVKQLQEEADTLVEGLANHE